MVLNLLGWTDFAVGWTTPNERASIEDRVLHGVPTTSIFKLNTQPGTHAAFVLGMFYTPLRPGEYAQGTSDDLQFYAVPRPSSSPWEVRVNYATFSFAVSN